MNKIHIPEDKLNQLISEVADDMLRGKTFRDGKVSGAEIAEFSRHKQINQFILFQIYQDWNSQLKKFIHPYFNFNHEEVVLAFQRFTNVLSRHIEVPEKDFKLMLEKAIYNTIKLIARPEDTFKSFFFMRSTLVPLDTLKKHANYFSDFGFAVQAIIKYCEKNRINSISQATFMEKLHKVAEIFESRNDMSIYQHQAYLFKDATGRELKNYEASEATAEKVAPVSKHESRSLGLHSNPVQPERKEYTQPKVEKQEYVTPKTEQPSPKVEEKKPDREDQDKQTPPPQAEEKKPLYSSFNQQSSSILNKYSEEKKTLADSFNKDRDQKPELEIQPEKRPEIQPEKHPEITPEKHPEIEPERQPEIEPDERPEITPEPKPEIEPDQNEGQPSDEKPKVGFNFTREEEDDKPIDLFGGREEKKTLADQFGGGKSSLHDNLGGNKIKVDQIPVHKQFQFIQKLFGGNQMKFKILLEKINETSSLEKAHEIMDRHIFSQGTIDKEDKTAKEFIQLVSNRFEG